jgi:superfamily II RNA helicase
MQYDRFQQEAIDCIKGGHSVIVSAPTGAGKTAIAEHVIETCIGLGRGVIYTAPIKALSNQKFRDFQHQYKDKIGILTGDVSLNPQAPVLIMTTEIFRNKILDEPHSLKKFFWVIYDEIHYIDNPERGTVWEESLILLPSHMRILGLSATVPNIEEFSLWLESVHRMPLKVIVEKGRPVPLHFRFQCQNKIIDDFKDLRKACYARCLRYEYRGRHAVFNRETHPNRLHTLIHYIRQNSGFPCIYFCFSRRRCEDLAQELLSFDFLEGDERKKITGLFNELTEHFDLRGEPSAKAMYPLIRCGIGYHHAGMLPTLKEAIEQLFTSRLLKVIFTTETFALGINMPARSVIFDELRKFYGAYVRNLKTRDFYQMAGRAGRRGIDAEGFVYSRINPHKIDTEEVRRIIYGAPEKVNSQFNTSYATLLHLYKKYGEGFLEIYKLSYHFYQANVRKKEEAYNLLHSKINFLKTAGYIKNNKLTTKGEFASCIYGYEIILSELFEKGYLENFNETELGILMAAVVFEPRRNDTLPPLKRQVKNLKNLCENLMKQILRQEARLRIYPPGKCPYFHLSNAVEAWIRGESFHKTLSQTSTDEGELVRYLRMSHQLLREVLANPLSSEILKEKISRLISKINRDIVDAEKQLRAG